MEPFYYYLVYDENNCSAIDSFTIDRPDSIQINAISYDARKKAINSRRKTLLKHIVR